MKKRKESITPKREEQRTSSPTSRKRDVSYKEVFERLKYEIFAGLVLIIGAVFFYFRGEYKLCKLAKHGESTQAVIVTFHDYMVPAGRRTSRTVNKAIYEYTVNGINYYCKTVQKDYSVNDTIEIIYLPQNPQKSDLREHVDRLPQWEKTIYEWFD